MENNKTKEYEYVLIKSNNYYVGIRNSQDAASWINSGSNANNAEVKYFYNVEDLKSYIKSNGTDLTGSKIFKVQRVDVSVDVSVNEVRYR